VHTGERVKTVSEKQDSERQRNAAKP